MDRRVIRRSIAAAAIVSLACIAGAQDPISHFAPDGVEIDGNYLDDSGSTGIDWYADLPPFSDPIAQDDDTLCGTSPAPKNDITNTFVANNFEYLFMGMERLANRGNTSFFFSFDITGDGPSFGDFIFVFCFGNGDTVSDTYVLEFDPVLGEFTRDATPPMIDFAVNGARTIAPFGALDRHGRPTSIIDTGKFGEARVLLEDIEGFDVCDADDVTVEIQTKSSCSLSSQCKDTGGQIHFSFAPLTAELDLSQPAGCLPEVVATANAITPRGTSVTYRWFLNGVEVTDLDPAWATSDTIVIPLALECGPTSVGVLVDDGTCIVEDEEVVDVNRKPVAGIGLAEVEPCDRVLSYAGSASSDCNGSALGHAWDFDSDGVIDSTDPDGTFLYSDCGERLVTLLVSDGECDSDPVTTRVYVNAPPEAGLVVRPSGAHCLEIAFDVTSTDCDLAESSDLYTERLENETDFGDGSATTTEITGVHRYAACGTYVVTTTVRDASGCVESVERMVSVDVVTEVE
jgi:hypothetical protein